MSVQSLPDTNAPHQSPTEPAIVNTSQSQPSPVKPVIDPIVVAKPEQVVSQTEMLAEKASLPTVEEDVPEAPEDPTSLYLFGDPQSDRARLVAQTTVSISSIRKMAPVLVKGTINDILDLGCGDGQLTAFLSTRYRHARVVGMEIDPLAIETARQNLKHLPNIDLQRIEFVAGDIQEKLPEGPFDLVHISAVMLHLKQPDKVLEMVRQVLRPGGTVWIKDLYPGWTLGIDGDDTTWQKLFGMLQRTMAKIGRNLLIGPQLEPMLEKAGFTGILSKREDLAISDDTFTGRTTMSICLGVIYNARKQIAMMEQIPEEEVMKLYNELSNNTDKLSGKLTLIHVRGQRPD